MFVLNSFLDNIGSQADEALNGKEAIDKIDRRVRKNCCKKYDLVLMDINMPIMDGIKASTIIREKIELKEFPQTIIVAMTADLLKDTELRELYAKTGFSDYMFKPTTREEFYKMLQKYHIIP